MTLKSDSNFEEKLTCGLKNDRRNLEPEHLSKLELWLCPFVQSRKFMSLKFTEELCVMTTKNDAKFEEELTFHFEIDMRNLTNFDLSTWRFKNFAL